MIDGVFGGDDAEYLHFQETCLTAEQRAHLQRMIRQRIVRLFVRRRLLDKAEGAAINTCKRDGGFSLDTSVRIEAHDRQGLERLFRYCAQPAFAQERLRNSTWNISSTRARNPAQVANSACCSPPHQLLDRLSALIPPPRRHRYRYYDQRKFLWDDVLAPNSPGAAV